MPQMAMRGLTEGLGIDEDSIMGLKLIVNLKERGNAI